MILEGYVTDKNMTPVADAVVEVKGEDFVTLYSAVSGENGYYRFDIPAGRYPFLTAVKEYGVNYLEYWCQNIPLDRDRTLDIRFDKLEIYGLHVFSVKGGGNGLMAYFRPMSLPRFQQGEADIAPEDFDLRVVVDGVERPVLCRNAVKEWAAGRSMSAYLIQIDVPAANLPWSKFEIEIRDRDGHYGAASIFNASC